MCGIAGIIGPRSQSARAELAVTAMLRALRHRGPDDEGLWQSNSGDARFAHTRLSILDLSAAGHQPMSTADGRFTITFNGEIYNFLTLRTELENQGVALRTRTDTEVILHLYAREGPACVQKLRGMFAFAIWDEREHSCFLARDPFGIKPLYISRNSDGMVFASELRALLDSGLVAKTLDPSAVTGYFKTGSVPEPLTMVKEARCLPAGHTLTWKDGKISTGPYQFVEFPTYLPPVKDPVAHTRAALMDSVRQHFVSDVPVGIFLSGGMDSTALLALARVTGQRDLQTYSVALEDAGLDESPAAKRTAEHFGSTHHEMRLTSSLGREMFDKFLSSIDQPSIDGFNTYVVSSLARERGAKVVLSGLGGDELLGGYSSFWKIPNLLRACHAAQAIPFIGATASKILQSRVWSPRLRRLGALLQEPVSIREAYRSYRGIYLLDEAQKLAMHATGATVEEAKYTGLPAVASDPLNAISELELTCYMRNQLLRDSDVMSMAHGLELRVPLVDSVLFNAIARLPTAVRIRQGKQLLADAVPEIPAWVMGQAKRGFVFPFADWLDSPQWKPDFDRALKDIPVPAVAWYQRWSVFAFKHWCHSVGIN